MLNKFAVIGVGNIGAVLVEEAARRVLARNIAAVDVKEPDVAAGKCLDIAEGLPIVGKTVNIVGSKDFSAIADADIVVNTAGVPRTVRPDGTIPTREELLTTNLKITKAVAAAIMEYAPNAIVINVANPLDAIVYGLDKAMNPPKNRLMGMAGQLDSARYRYFFWDFVVAARDAASTGDEGITGRVQMAEGWQHRPVRLKATVAGGRLQIDLRPRSKWVVSCLLIAPESEWERVEREMIERAQTG